jgi:hypothetical protein
MAEKTNTKKTNEHQIPQEARDHFRAAREEMRDTFKNVIPPEFREHRRNAHREMLLGWRSLIDSALKRMDVNQKKS